MRKGLLKRRKSRPRREAEFISPGETRKWKTGRLVNPYYSGPKTDHFDGHIFFNPGGKAPGAFRDVVKWRLVNKPAQWPEYFPSPFHGLRAEPRVGGDRAVITLVGHASMLIQLAGKNILADPVWSERVSPVQFAGPKRVNPPAIAIADLPAIDIVLVTHNHYDHLDLATVRKFAARDNPLFITPLGNDVIIRRVAPKARIATGDWDDRFDTDDGLVFHFVNMHHWSARGISDRRMALWAGFVLQTEAGNILHIGDTGFGDGSHFSALRERFGSFSAANIPIGAYEPRWFMKSQHVNPEEAVKAMQLVGASMAVGHHWGTFQLTEEAIEAPKLALELACEKHGVPTGAFAAALPGQSFQVPLQPVP
jgi:L-ascorbate metabolism protein UlaG (beta-lactamase superfamily)